MTRRSDNVTFVRETNKKEERLSYCRLCQEKHGKLNKLVPRLINNIPDDKFKQCSFCGELVEIYNVKWESQYEPKGSLTTDPYNPFNQSGTRVSVIRNKRVNKSNKKEGIEPIEVPKLAGKEDEDLIRLLHERPGILNYYSDTIVEDSDLEGY